ncbi:MAG: lipid-binding SYLF domain-containing protein, partial [Acidobacteriales bacterium]|nr:lipid-binding SYLF domain-containing protein [Terriglobales bacterium]
MSNIGRQYIPAWPKMLILPSLSQAVYESGDPSPHIESKRSGIQILKKDYMKSKSMIRMVAAFCLALVVGTVAQAQAKMSLRDEVSQSERAARVFREIMDTPDKGIPQELLENAECVAVFPSVLKAGFILGGRGGRGVASCRTASGWSAQAYFTLGGGSFGLQIGFQSTDFVMLFMNKDGLNSLLSDEFTLGG